MEENQRVTDQKQQLEFIEDFAKMISKSFTKFAELCRHQITSIKSTAPSLSNQTKNISSQPKTVAISKPVEIKKTLPIGQNIESLSKQENRKPHNAFSLFIIDQRQKILKEQPTLDFMKVTSIATMKWKNMNEEQKKPFLQKYQLLKNSCQKQKDSFDPEDDLENNKSKKNIKEIKSLQKEAAAEQQERQDVNEHQSSSLQESKLLVNQAANKNPNQINTLQDLMNFDENGNLSRPVLHTQTVSKISEQNYAPQFQEDQPKNFDQSILAYQPQTNAEEAKIEDRDDYQNIKFSQEQRAVERPINGEVIIVPQTQNE